MTARQQVVIIRETSPCLTLRAIGNKVGVSGERVRQILNSEKMATRHWTARSTRCPQCGGKKSMSARVCMSCHSENHHVWLACDECGILFKRRLTLVLHCIGKDHQEHVWCSKKCQGKWFGKNYGKGRRKQ